MSENKPNETPSKLSLPVLPDPQRIARVLARAESARQEAGMSQQSNEAAPESASGDEALRQKVIGILKTIYDPEIPVNIYEMGLIYEIRISPEKNVNVRMTLTAPACPVAETLPLEVESKINAIPEVNAATVDLVWDPPWDKDRMSEEAKLQLGIF